MKKIRLILFLFIFSPSVSEGQSWTQKSSFPGEARVGAVPFVLNNNAYVGFGMSWDSSLSANLILNDLYQYNQRLDQWVSIPNTLVRPRTGAVSFEVNGEAFVGLGWNPNLIQTYRSIYKFDDSLMTMTAIDSFPGYGGRNSAAAAMDGKGYVCAGHINYTFPYSNEIWEYDPILNSWTQKANFPGTRTGGLMFAIDTLLYFGFGHDGSTDFADLWSFNPRSNTWSPINNFPGVGRLQARAMVVNGKAIIGGGFRKGIFVELDDYYQFDPTNNSWLTLNSFSAGARSNFVFFGIEDKGYIATGENRTGNYLNDLWEYSDISVGQEEISSLSNSFSIYPNPSNGQLYLCSHDFNNEPHSIRIYSIVGNLILEKVIPVSQEVTPIDFNELAPGNYFYVVNSSKDHYTGSIMISK